MWKRRRSLRRWTRSDVPRPGSGSIVGVAALDADLTLHRTARRRRRLHDWCSGGGAGENAAGSDLPRNARRGAAPVCDTHPGGAAEKPSPYETPGILSRNGHGLRWPVRRPSREACLRCGAVHLALRWVREQRPEIRRSFHGVSTATRVLHSNAPEGAGALPLRTASSNRSAPGSAP